MKASLIRKVGGSKSPKKGTHGSGSDSDGGGFEEGDKVEARFGGKDKWFKGKITRKRSDPNLSSSRTDNRSVFFLISSSVIP